MPPVNFERRTGLLQKNFDAAQTLGRVVSMGQVPSRGQVQSHHPAKRASE